jgi:hypothetical protein
MSDTRVHTEPLVHAAAGWWRVACMSDRAPEGTYSTVKTAHVTCPECKALLGHLTDEEQTRG